MMVYLHHFLASVLLCCVGLSLLTVVQAQDQTGFISLDCGLPADTSYTERTTNIRYISDANYIDSGENKSIHPQYQNSGQLQQLLHVRSFPQETRNCYEISVVRGTKYLIRANFLYGNYDGINSLPIFHLYYGANLWDVVNITDASYNDFKEMIDIPLANEVHICLANISFGTPFISAIELRPMRSDIYVTASGSLSLFTRLDIGSTTGQYYRYEDDAFDRIWKPFRFSAWKSISTSSTIDSNSNNDYQPPSIVMTTASTSTNASASMDFFWVPPDKTTEYYVYIHFVEIEKLQAKQARVFNITLNGGHWFGPFSPRYLSPTTVYSPSALSGGSYNFSLVRNQNSTLPPIINAIEIFTSVQLSTLGTYKADVDAIKNIKSTYGVKKSWRGDPCTPTEYPWSGLNCSVDIPPRITSLNLSSSGLTGVISSYIFNLPMLQTLDLSNNNLTGTMPDFLSKLSHLKVLNLENNMLNGSIPSDLIARFKDGSLSLRVGGNPRLDTCAMTTCTKTESGDGGKKNNIVVPIVSTVGGLVLVVIIIVIVMIFCYRKRKQKQTPLDNKSIPMVQPTDSNSQMTDSLEAKRRQFSYSEVVKMTNNFERILGRGGFGLVYYGLINEVQVAVKILSTTSRGHQQFERGFQQFQAEVKLLMRVHHRNLTNFFGYLNEGTHIGLIYEYMANGNLADHLSEKSPRILTWEDRLRIAMDAAQGLEYLHDNCQPPIIHRDVKTTNILLTENFQAKLADFGLSKINPAEGGNHLSTVIAGTPGYLDPQYYSTNMLTEKSDVYSFGVALLEIITCRSVISRTQDKLHITRWASSMIANGDIKNIVDPRLRGNFDVNSVWKAVEIALACVKMELEKRPTMNEVVAELKSCLATELSRRRQGNPLESTDSVEIVSVTMVNASRPMPR